ADLELLQVARRLPAHRPFREHAQDEPERSPPPGLSSQEDVRGDVERGSDREILIDGLDACAARIAWRTEADAHAVETDLSLVRLQRARERLDQRRLAGPVVADHSDDLVRIELEIDSVERNNLPVPLGEPAGFKNG